MWFLEGLGGGDIQAGPAEREGSAPVASQNVSAGVRLWEGNQGPLMKLQVWQ